MPSRRSFLKMAGGLVVAISAPVFIPSDRLEFGVPKPIIVPEPTIRILGTPLQDTRLVNFLNGRLANESVSGHGITLLEAAMNMDPHSMEGALIKMFTGEPVAMVSLPWKQIQDWDDDEDIDRQAFEHPDRSLYASGDKPSVRPVMTTLRDHRGQTHSVRLFGADLLVPLALKQKLERLQESEG